MRDEADEQLLEYLETAKEGVTDLTNSLGAPVNSLTTVLTAGPRGPVLLQDTNFLDVIGHFNRERIPERVVHAKGAGAKGYFEVTHDITQYTKAKLFSKIGKLTDIAVRFSTVAGEKGSADTIRDVRGFAVKFYTEDGIFDLVGNNSPVFFIRDPILFPSMVHSQKKNPVTNLKDANMFWDFVTLRPESIHQIMFLFSERGIPDGYRHMNGYGSHTFKFVNAEECICFIKFHFKPEAKVKNLTSEEAAAIAAKDPDYSTRDLYNAICRGDCPAWTLYIQVMTPDQAGTDKTAFDLTKIWPHSTYPLIQVGRMVLNQNPKNYFTDVEQIAFCPGNMVPGIEPSPDKMLQGRLFAYADTHRYRLGPNFTQLPINCPFRSIVANYQRDGYHTLYNQNGAPNYYPNSFGGPRAVESARIQRFIVENVADRYRSKDEDNYSQAASFWRDVLNDDERKRLVKNIVDDVKTAADFIQERVVGTFCSVSEDLAGMIFDELQKVKEKDPSRKKCVSR